jgi:diguanylate cyclase (GGDEF)-like protein
MVRRRSFPPVLRREARAGQRPAHSATVSLRLLGAVALPLALLGVVTAEQAFARRDDARAAREIARTASVLNDLVELRATLFVERLGFEAAAHTDSLSRGLGGEAGTGTGPGPPDLAARAGTDAALVALSAHDRPFGEADLARLRLSVDAGALGIPVVSGRYGRLDDTVTAALAVRFSDLRRDAVDVGEPDLAEATALLSDVVEAMSHSGVLVNRLAGSWFSAPFEARLAQSELARATDRFAAVAARLATASREPLATTWPGVTREAEHFDDAVDDVLKGVASPLETHTLDPDQLEQILDVGLRRTIAIGRLATSVADHLGRTASGVDDRAGTSAALAALLALGSTVVSLLAAAWFGRSIVRPVHRLTTHARKVGDGDLNVTPLPLQGPPEFMLASRAVNDLVANLLLLEQKADALSACAFDDPVLGRPLPGALGQSLQRSAQVLSEFVHQATHDTLTGVTNRAGAIEALTQAVARAQRSGGILAVVFVDLDGFKQINDTYGHAAGDEVLRVVALRMRATTRGGDVVARLGGAELVVLSENLGDTDGATALAGRLIRAIAEPVDVDDRHVSVGACAGVALSGIGADAPLELLRKADVAVYAAKKRGPASIAVYAEALERQRRADSELEEDLSMAVHGLGGELHLRYQPIVDTGTGRLSAVEALVRWDRPGHGPVPPSVFIPIAETSNLVVELDRWVLDTATRQLAAWAGDPALADITLAVNISGVHLLHPSFATHVADALEASGIAPARLVLEVTETVLVTDLARAARQIDTVRALGVRIALDDFGTGFTGLAHLRSLTIDEIKIDRSFVEQLPGPVGRGIVQMIIDLAEHLGIPTVAEGVETDEQLEALCAIGCRRIQGYLFAEPLDPDALVPWAATGLAEQRCLVRPTAPR